MLLSDIFGKYGYKSLLDKEVAESLNLEMEIFVEDNVYPQELKGIYISSKFDEIFFVLDSSDIDVDEMSKFWDRKISSFLVFGSEDKVLLNKIKYNITQIIINNKNIENKNLESSLTISRKIYVLCYKDQDNKYHIEEEDMFLLPFILVEPGDYHPDEKILSQLKNFLPKDESLGFLDFEIKRVKKVKNDNCIKKTFDDSQFEAIKGWLEK